MRTNNDLYPLSEIVKLAQAKGVDFGKASPENRIRYYIKFGLLPHAKRKSFHGETPSSAFKLDVVDQLVQIERLSKKGVSVASQRQLLQIKPAKKVVKPQQNVDIQTLTQIVENSNRASRYSLAATAVVAVLVVISLLSNLILPATGNQKVLGVSTDNENGFVKVAKAIVSPLSYLNLGILKIVKTGDSLDPLGLTNISNYIQKDGDKLTFTNKIDADLVNTKTINGHQINNKENSFVTLNNDGDLVIPGEIKTEIDWQYIKNKPDLAGSVNLVAGSNISISKNSLTGAFTISSSATSTSTTVINTGGSGGGSGTITSVVAGTGLTGGGSSGSVTLNIGTSVTQLGNTFNGVSQLVQLNALGELPTLPGINLTNLNASNIASGSLADARLSSNVTLLGNSFNGASQLVQLNGSIQLPAISGALLTNLSATSISSGTVADARLSTNVTLQGNLFNGVSQLVQLDGSGALPALSGANLTGITVSASNITTGTLGNAGVTLALASFGSITGSLDDTNVADNITASNYLPLTGGTLTGSLTVSGVTTINPSSGLPLTVIETGANDIINLCVTNCTGTNKVFQQSSTGLITVNPTATLTSTSQNALTTNFTWDTTGSPSLTGINVTATAAAGTGSGGGNVYGVYSNITYSGMTGRTYGVYATNANVYGGSGANTTTGYLASAATSFTVINCGTIATVGVGVCGAGTGNAYGVTASSATSYALIADTTSGITADFRYGSGSRLSITGNGTLGALLDFKSATAGSTSIIKIPRTAGACGGTGVAEGLVFQDTAAAQLGHICMGNAGTLQFYAGNFNAGATDLAENYSDIQNNLQPGDLVTIDTVSGTTKAVTKTTTSYDQNILGVVSTAPGLLLSGISEAGGTTDLVNPKPVAISGRVPTKVSTENGPISVGDPLTSSSTPGIAMKATTSGPTVGKALEAYNGSGFGKILVFVNISYYLNPSDFPAYTLKNSSNLSVTLGYAAKYVWQNSSGKIVASVNDLGEAVFSKVTTLFADISKLVFGEVAVKKGSQSAGVGEIPTDQNEIVIPSNKVKDDSLINLTANSEPDGVLYVKTKTAGVNFVVGIKRFPGNTTNQKVDFNWLIVNQE